ncbi:sialate O-acetylesterase-like [Haliotis rufescens]|uniref:sialate O-acetylesterase-like n=1 Tax=Haliotis rufescens TaxID=6454 RepID=UPI00201EE72C|nr:sialate O-acetylesterase-like [Haliotis rufescens]
MTPLLFFLFTVSGVLGDLKLASYYGDHMMLQRGPQRAVMWGKATVIGDEVTVAVSGAAAVKTTVVNDPSGTEGLWKVKLPAITDPGPVTVKITSSEGEITLSDVLFGDVWVCAGQSNMGFALSRVMNSSAEITEALKFKNIRIFKTGQVESPSPLEDLKNVSTPWTAPTQDTVSAFSAVCWLFGEYLYPHRNYPIGLVESAWGGTPIEPWSSPDALAKCPQPQVSGPKNKSVVWNAMINPLLDMTIYGTLWYQGEGGMPNFYGCQFSALIQDWRQKFRAGSEGETDAAFPFGFAQLAPNMKSDDIGVFPGIRWSQTAGFGFVPNQKMPQTFMAVAMDLPDYNSPYKPIHPRYKQDVAHRLVLGARAIGYKEPNVIFRGPFPKTFSLDNDQHTLKITYGQNNPLDVRNNHGFEVCCSSQSTTKCTDTDEWVAAPITDQDTHSVSVSVAGCVSKSPVGLRYEWRKSPCDLKQCAIYGKDTDLPAPPYIRENGFN